MRLTASRIMCEPWPVFHSLQAGQRTLATVLSRAYWSKGPGAGGRGPGAWGPGGAARAEKVEGLFLDLAHGFDHGAAAGDAAGGEELGLLIFQGVELVEEAGGCKAERGAGFAGGPDVHQAVHHVLFQLQAQFVTRRTRGGDTAAAEPVAVVADH